MMTIARKLAENPRINTAIRDNIYIHGVTCACESAKKSSKTVLEGTKCFCDVNVDLLGSNKHIKTYTSQPTDKVSIEIDPKNATKYADTAH